MGKTSKEGIAWLLENQELEDVNKTHSGMQYRVLRAGDSSGLKPSPSTECEVTYIGRFMNGTQITDSTVKNKGKPSKFTPSQTLKCMGEAMLLMREGDQLEVFCPSELAFGKFARTYNGFRIPGGTVLVLELKMVTVGERPDPTTYPYNRVAPVPWEIESPIVHLNDIQLDNYLRKIKQAMVFFYDSDCPACQKKVGMMSEWASLMEDTHSVAAVNCKDNFRSCGVYNISEVPTLVLVNNFKHDVRPYRGNLTIAALMQFWDQSYTYMLKKDGLTSNMFIWDQLLDYVGNIEQFMEHQSLLEEEIAEQNVPDWMQM